MPKQHNSQKRTHDGKSKKNGNGTSRGNGNKSNPAKTKAILKMKPARKPEHTIKASFEDVDGNEVKELIYTFDDGDPKDNCVLTQLQLRILGRRYQLWEDDKYKKLTQVGGRAFSGRAAEVWADKVENARAPRANANREEYFVGLLKEFSKKYFGKNAGEDQKDAMENGELTYDGHDHFMAVERLLKINTWTRCGVFLNSRDGQEDCAKDPQGQCQA